MTQRTISNHMASVWRCRYRMWPNLWLTVSWMYHFCNRILSFFFANTSWKTVAMNLVFIVPFLDQRTCIGTTVILVVKFDNNCLFYLHLLFIIHNKLIVYLLFIVGLKTIMFISYSSSQVLKLISVDHYMKSLHVYWALWEILEKAGYWKKKPGWLC